MSEHTKIEWCDHTFNPWKICTPVSPGCANCYAAAMAQRWYWGEYKKGEPRLRTSPVNWRDPLKWNKRAKEFPALCSGCGARYRDAEDLALPYVCSECGGTLAYQRPRVFCASLSDWLDDEAPIEWLADLLELIHATPNLDWLLLTKRPQNFFIRLNFAISWLSGAGGANHEQVIQWLHDWLAGSPPRNVWIGTTTEDQERANERIPLLLQIPAKVRFLSCEPLLGPIDLQRFQEHLPPPVHFAWLESIDWVICGGESGRGARPMHVDWARDLRDQCEAAGVPFFFKQWGEWIARSQAWQSGKLFVEVSSLKTKRTAVMRRDGKIDKTLGPAMSTNDDDSAIYHCGKKIAGRLLDGREHSAFPEVSR